MDDLDECRGTHAGRVEQDHAWTDRALDERTEGEREGPPGFVDCPYAVTPGHNRRAASLPAAAMENGAAGAPWAVCARTIQPADRTALVARSRGGSAVHARPVDDRGRARRSLDG